MTEEIKKLIVEQAENYSERIKKNTSFKSNERIAAAAGFTRGAIIISEIILSKWQEAERWRKFTTDDLPNLGMRILLKNGNRRDTTVVHSHQHIHELAECFTKWKPIS